MTWAASPFDPRRKSARHPAEHVGCEIGDVLDLSAGGMRVAGKGRVPLRKGTHHNFRLRVSEGVMRIAGRVAWIRKTGFRRYEMGIQFLSVDAKLAKALESLAEFGFIGPGGSRTSKGANGFASAGTSRDSFGRTIRAAIDLPDFYALLGVNYNATLEDIHRAYRGLARLYHPDVAKVKGAEQKFIQIKQAYEVLKDPERRALYDLGQAA